MHTAESAVCYIYIIVWLFVDSGVLRRLKTEVQKFSLIYTLCIYFITKQCTCDHSLISLITHLYH